MRDLTNKVPLDEALARVTEPALRETCERLHWGTVGIARNRAAEISYAVDLAADQAIRLGVDLERRYPSTGPHVVCGTLDLEAERITGVPIVIDWKWGYQPVTSAAENPQIQFAALARHWATGAPEVEGRIGYVRPSGHIHWDRATFDAFELESFADRQLALAEKVEDARKRVRTARRLPVVTGEHCRYCPAILACPAHTAMAKQLLPELAAIKHELASMTPVQCGAAMVKAKTIGRLLEMVLDGMNEIMDRGIALPTTPGKEYRAIPVEQRRFSKERAMALLRELGATAEQIENCDVITETIQHREVKAR